MSILQAPSPATKPIAVAAPDVDPWYADRPTYAVDRADLAFGARIRHKVIGGVWKVVRGPERLDSTSRFTIRVREQAANGSLFGAVLSWRLDEVACLVGDETGIKIFIQKPTLEISKDEAPAPDAYTEAIRKMTALAEAELVLRGDERAEHAAKVAEVVARREAEGRPSPAPVVEQVGTFSPAWYDASRVVALGDACWMPPRSRVEAMVQRDAIRHELARMRAGLDDATLDARAAHDDACEAEAMARHVEADEPCCDDAEPSPCSGCVNVHTLPDDLSGSDWEDDWRYELGPDEEPFAAWIRRQADAYAASGTDRGAWLAGKLARLAEQATFLDADDPEVFDDRLSAQLDAARDAAESRLHSGCC